MEGFLGGAGEVGVAVLVGVVLVLLHVDIILGLVVLVVLGLVVLVVGLSPGVLNLSILIFPASPSHLDHFLVSATSGLVRCNVNLPHKRSDREDNPTVARA